MLPQNISITLPSPPPSPTGPCLPPLSQWDISEKKEFLASCLSYSSDFPDSSHLLKTIFLAGCSLIYLFSFTKKPTLCDLTGPWGNLRVLGTSEGHRMPSECRQQVGKQDVMMEVALTGPGRGVGAAYLVGWEKKGSSHGERI